MFSHPAFFCVVAEQNGKAIGSNCLDERTPIAGIGPITIDPAAQNRAVGRQLMQAVMTRATERKFAGIRLVQAASTIVRSRYMRSSVSWCVSRCPVCRGRQFRKYCRGTRFGPRERETSRPATTYVSESTATTWGRTHDAIQQGTAVVVEYGGNVTAYASSVAFFGHAVGETNEDLKALIAAAPAFQGSGILVPTRNAGLFRWCLENGLRVVQPMTLMTVGLYNEPAGAYLPSILF